METQPRLLTALGIAALAAGAADAQTPEPAAKLRPPVPITLRDGSLVTRGLSPEARPFDPTRGPQPSDSATTPGGWPAPSYGTPKPMIETTRAPWAATKQPSMLESAWSDMKDLVSGKAPEPLPAPRSPYTFANPSAVQPPQPVATGVYAGPPAYRWYGWGATTPGTNPYAPGGVHPRGSGNWFAQTGATPGAFPVPVSAPRYTFGAEPPSYVGLPNMAPMASETIVNPPARAGLMHERAPVVVEQPMSAVSVQPPGAGPLVPLTTIPVPPRTPALPAPDLKVIETSPSIPNGQPIPLSVVPSGATTDLPASDGVAWQRSGTLPAPLPVTTRGEAKAPPVVHTTNKPSAMELAVRTACQGSVTVTDYKVAGPNRLIVEVTAANNADARAAFEKVSGLPQLKQYEVQFEVRLTGK